MGRTAIDLEVSALAGRRFAARFEDRVVIAACGPVAPSVPVYILYSSESRTQAYTLWMYLKRAGYYNAALERR